MKSRLCFLVGVVVFFQIVADQSSSLADDIFKSKVSKIFATRCVACHNDKNQKGGITLQSKLGFLDSEIVTPLDVQNSPLVDAIVSHDGKPASMPKGRPQLTDSEIDSIRAWIKEGEAWPDDFHIDPQENIDFDWWSFHPLKRPLVPKFDDPTAKTWIENPIDSFVLRQLRKRKLKFSNPADRRTLLRRVTFDLTGLPPTFKETQAFIQDESADAYEKVVDRLLASPRYGERWAQHWLDVVKYADTCGYDKDKLRPNAWPYRDYVIRSFNSDKPYSQFVEEQIAGDSIYPETKDGILGLGFIAAGPWDFIGHVEVPESKMDGKVARNLDRDEMVSNSINTFTSLTIQCARCHDHKFDPFTQEHYYGLQAVFAAVDRAERVYDVDPEIESRRKDIVESLLRYRQQLTKLNESLKIGGSNELAKAQARVDKLSAGFDKLGAFGFHSAISADPTSQKWVEVDLESKQEIRRIVLNPCNDDFAGIGPGFGFPVRFKIEIDGVSVYESVDKDFPNPKLDPITIDCRGAGNTVRVTATTLAPRQNDFIFALAELQVFDENQKNVALSKPVNALDSIEAPKRWAKSNLTDGLWFSASDEAAKKDELATAELSLAMLQRKLLGPEKFREFEILPDQIAQLEKQLAEIPQGKMVYAAATHFPAEGGFQPTLGTPRSIHVLHRGDIDQPMQNSPAGTLPLFANDSVKFKMENAKSESANRAALARWITNPRNPLTWRSVVNRLWQHHFGAGIVATPNDFGRMGASPTHPELLDWLAMELIENNGSLKHIHRLMVLSATYRQSSTHVEENARADSTNQYLWRANRRKLSAEEVRDATLAITAKLNMKMGGPGFYLFDLTKTEHSPHYEYHTFDHRDQETYRRSIYRFVVRSQPDPYLASLDCADTSQSTPRRNETQTALQALALLNNEFNLVMAEHMANHLAKQPDIKSQIRLAYQEMFARQPSSIELDTLTPYVQRHGLKNLARIMFNLSEFTFID